MLLLTITDSQNIIKVKNLKWGFSKLWLCVIDSLCVCQSLFVRFHRMFVKYITVSLVTRLGSSVGSMSPSYASGLKIDPRVRNIFDRKCFPLPLTPGGQAVSYWRKFLSK